MPAVIHSSSSHVTDTPPPVVSPSEVPAGWLRSWVPPLDLGAAVPIPLYRGIVQRRNGGKSCFDAGNRDRC